VSTSDCNNSVDLRSTNHCNCSLPVTRASQATARNPIGNQVLCCGGSPAGAAKALRPNYLRRRRVNFFFFLHSSDGCKRNMPGAETPPRQMMDYTTEENGFTLGKLRVYKCTTDLPTDQVVRQTVLRSTHASNRQMLKSRQQSA
jgi:hypothetical protein